MKDIELRTADFQREGQKIKGYAVRWMDESHLLFGEFRERFAQKAFNQYLSTSPDVRFLFEHQFSALLGRTTSKTLLVEEDDTGLRFELNIPDIQIGRDAATMIDRGDITGVSFGFRALSDEWITASTPYLRTVLTAELSEISLTSVPAYPTSSVEIAHRSLFSQHPELRRAGDNRRRWADLAGL
ncbi:HK97 family phage prohead protease [Cronobacter sakazakii]|uniref:HK97 family phage prohead protease n=1 Tax=Cronobacter sakazakii TaxID=28141 RepID=UPI001BCDD604|nr:HK97 family phage prohead protease [Cronobacter sakazakii]MBS4491529.1 HK97 family phage prohead protease [Cronobacter sakazakii]